MREFNYFRMDVTRILGSNKYRIIFIWMSRAFIGVFTYRLERSLYLVFKEKYKYIRLFFAPIIYLLQAYSNIDIHYKANILGGLLILHPSIGIVISGRSKIGENLTLTGGNLIGINKKKNKGVFKIGNNCEMGANSTIIGNLRIANNIKIGANACVTKDCLIDGSVLVGVPAKIKFSKIELI